MRIIGTLVPFVYREFLGISYYINLLHKKELYAAGTGMTSFRGIWLF